MIGKPIGEWLLWFCMFCLFVGHFLDVVLETSDVSEGGTFLVGRSMARGCAIWTRQLRERLMDLDLLLVGGLEHDFYDLPYIGNNNPN